MESIENKKRFIGFEASAAFADALKEKARQERRTMASYMKKALSDTINYEGDV